MKILIYQFNQIYINNKIKFNNTTIFNINAHLEQSIIQFVKFIKCLLVSSPNFFFTCV